MQWAQFVTFATCHICGPNLSHLPDLSHLPFVTRGPWCVLADPLGATPVADLGIQPLSMQPLMSPQAHESAELFAGAQIAAADPADPLAATVGGGGGGGGGGIGGGPLGGA